MRAILLFLSAIMAIKRGDIQKVALSYDPRKITIGVLGSHSAEEVGIAAKAFGFPTVVICQKGREELYTKYNRHLFDHKIILDKFSDIVNKEVQARLAELNTVFIPNRSFSVYLGYDKIENKFNIPLYGNRQILRSEERSEAKNQYWLLTKAGIKMPKRFSRPGQIDRTVIVKAQQASKAWERAFFYAKSEDEYYEKSKELIKHGIINETGLKKAVIEEYVLGQKFNGNFQAWALEQSFDSFDFLGFDDRKQTSLHGVLGLPAKEQLTLDVAPTMEEVGHYGLTMRESQKPLVYKAADRFIAACRKEYSPGLIGLFSLQGALAHDPDSKKELNFYVFDVSPRIPGAPPVGPTSPEMRRLTLKYRKHLKLYNMVGIETMMDLPMLELKEAVSQGLLDRVVT